MRPKTKRHLTLTLETLRSLDAGRTVARRELAAVHGGQLPETAMSPESGRVVCGPTADC